MSSRYAVLFSTLVLGAVRTTIGLLLHAKPNTRALNASGEAIVALASVPPVQEYPYKDWQDKSSLDMYPPMLIGATWGMNNCQGLADTSTDNTIAVGCPTVPLISDTSAQNCTGDGALSSRALSPVFQAILMKGNSRGLNLRAPYPLSAVAVKFSWQINSSSLDWSDFEFTMSDDSTVKPWGLSIAPANDPEEAFTVTLYGSFGNTTRGYNNDWTEGEEVGPYMVSLEIVDELIVTNGSHSYDMKGAYFAGGNLNYSKGGVLTTAYIREWSPQQARGPTEKMPISYGADNCSAFRNTTHVLTAQTMGGTTYDGVNGFGRTAWHARQLFTVMMLDNSTLRDDAFLGLADIDNDDFTDICLQLEDDDVDQMGKLVMSCTGDVESEPCANFALPHGNAQGFAQCTDTQAQVITTPVCPGSVVCR